MDFPGDDGNGHRNQSETNHSPPKGTCHGASAQNQILSGTIRFSVAYLLLAVT